MSQEDNSDFKRKEVLVSIISKFKEEKNYDFLQFLEEVEDKDFEYSGVRPVGYHMKKDYGIEITEAEAEVIMFSRRKFNKGAGKLALAGLIASLGLLPKDANSASLNINKIEEKDSLKEFVLSDGYYFQYSANNDEMRANHNLIRLKYWKFSNVFLHDRRIVNKKTNKKEGDILTLLGPYPFSMENFEEDRKKLIDFIYINYGHEHYSSEFMILKVDNTGTEKPEKILKLVRLQEKKPVMKVDKSGKEIIEDYNEIQRYIRDRIIEKAVQAKEQEKEQEEKKSKTIISIFPTRRKKKKHESHIKELKTDISSSYYKTIKGIVFEEIDKYNKDPWYGKKDFGYGKEEMDPFIILATIKKESDFKPMAIGYDIEPKGDKWVVKIEYGPNGEEIKTIRAKGLMQLAKIALTNGKILEKEFHGKRKEAEMFFNSRRIFNEQKNIELGIRHFAYTLYNISYIFDGNGKPAKIIPYKNNFERINFALAAYNGGTTAIKNSITRYRKSKGIKFGDIKYTFDDVKSFINQESRQYVPKTREFYASLKEKESA